MPFLQEKKDSLQEELGREHVKPAEESLRVRVAQAGAPPTQQAQTPQLSAIISLDKPLFLSQADSEEKQRRDDLIAKGMKAFKEDDPTLTERMKKLQALVYAMRDKEDGLGIGYARYNKPTKPKTAEEAYIAKEGDCDDLSRLYAALAEEQLGITNLSQFYVVFRNEKTGKEEGHAALFFVEGDVLYIDPAFEKAYVIHTKSKSIEEAVKDPEFRKDLEKCQFEATGKTDMWKVREVKTINGPQSMEAVYCFEMGNYSLKIDEMESAEKYTIAAIEGGIKGFQVYFLLGEILYFSKKYAAAAESLETASKTKEDAKCYEFLGLSYSDREKPDNELAAVAFRKQVTLEPQNYDAKYNLASSCKDAGDDLMDARQYEKALVFYTEAESVLRKIKDVKKEDKDSIEKALTDIEAMKKKANKELSK